ncbi:MAG: DUF4125 family protein [Chloroflexi bacterium]|nr:DUF4125 family protein [Chloroflexota bacterium]
MDRRQDVTDRIIDIEWRMFQKVPNIGGTAACQEDFKTFEINRAGQAMSWSDPTLESYLNDLTEAEAAERNLLTEKYARMMKSTSPEEYAGIQHLLPLLSFETLDLIDRIAEIVLKWDEALLDKYPYVLGRGRPLRSSDDTFDVTSVETYLRGELATYSLKTLQLYYENLLGQESEKVNGSEIAYSYTVKRYGFASLEEANARLGAGLDG